MKSGQVVFALDIGTRTVVGLVVRKESRGYTILAQESIEHDSRVMYDGQIHDIEAVADSVRHLKLNLEEKLGTRLEEAAVAAAGRALYTTEAMAEKAVSPYVEVSKKDIESLEAEALSLAAKSIARQTNAKVFEEYYCVGYNPVKWLLENVVIDNLLGQKGRSISVEIVATFLPRTVVDSLVTVLSRSGLTLGSITLEPIAASSVAILPGMRKLNIALVDIGAGTSDIAVSTDGSIFAYGMVPVAGDEITEKICETYLLDFYVGEKVKRSLCSQDQVEFIDILGQAHKLSSQEMLRGIMPFIRDLADAIAGKIIELNGKVPAAVICIGGGSQLPGLTGCIAVKLGLPGERAGVKGREGITPISGGDDLSGPFCVTPIGIAVNALEGTTLSFINVVVGDKTVNLLGQDRPTVLSALLQGGYSSAQIFGRPGLALTFTLNGELKIVPGKMGKPSEMILDDKAVDLNTQVYDNAVIKFIKGKDGENARAKVQDFIPEAEKTSITINGRSFNIDPAIEMNGKPASPDEDISEDAVVIIRPKELILSDIFNIISFKPDKMPGKLITNINGIAAGFSDTIKCGDAIDIYWQSQQNL